jgi:hypothetical protein
MSLETILESIALAGWTFVLTNDGYSSMPYSFAYWPKNTNPTNTVQQGFEGKTPIEAIMRAKEKGDWNLEEVRQYDKNK